MYSLRIVAAFALSALVACGTTADLDAPVEPLGDFFLGHTIVVADNATMGPLSREAEPAQWQEILGGELKRRFGRFDGDRIYHLAVHVDGYILAVPGIPLVAAPKSALIVGVTIWDDGLGRPLNDRPHQVTVLENLSGETLIGSGLTQTAEQQMRNLSENAAYLIERWLRDNIAWFETGAPPSNFTTTPPAAVDAAAAAPAL